MKRLLSLFLLFFIAICLFGANENYDFQDETGLYYKITSLDNKTCEVVNPNVYGTYLLSPYSGDIVIPSSVTYDGIVYDVVSIGGLAFYGCGDLTSIVIPDNVTRIGSEAFYGCYGLTSLEIPNSVKRIEGHVFYGCYIQKDNINNQSSIDLSTRGLTICDVRTESGICIKDNVFVKYLGKDSAVEVYHSLVSIADMAFQDCSSLVSVAISNSLTSIGNFAFSGCSSLMSITIPNSVTSIGDNAFSGCI